MEEFSGSVMGISMVVYLVEVKLDLVVELALAIVVSVELMKLVDSGMLAELETLIDVLEDDDPITGTLEGEYDGGLGGGGAY